MALNYAYIYEFVNGEQTWRYANVGSEQDLDDDVATPLEIAHTAPTIDGDFSKANVQITAPFDVPVAQLYTPFIPPIETQVFIYKAYIGVTDFALYWQGRVIRPEFKGGTVTLFCDTTLAGLNIEGLPESHQNLCNYFLGDGRCPVNLAAHRIGVTVDDIDISTSTGVCTLTVTGITEIDGWFKGGTIQAPNGDIRFIVEHVGDELTLESAFPTSTLAEGDTPDIFPGCDRLYSTCINKFGDETGDGDAFGGNPIVPKTNPHEYGRLL